MINTILKHYFTKLPWLMPVAVDVLTPSDYHLYLYATEAMRFESNEEEPQKWYVLVEANHPWIDQIVKDIESSFPVTVEGWCVLKEKQAMAHAHLLLDGTFDKYDSNNSDRTNYQLVAYYDDSTGIDYFLLKVSPHKGINLESFGLSYYK